MVVATMVQEKVFPSEVSERIMEGNKMEQAPFRSKRWGGIGGRRWKQPWPAVPPKVMPSKKVAMEVIGLYRATGFY